MVTRGIAAALSLVVLVLVDGVSAQSGAQANPAMNHVQEALKQLSEEELVAVETMVTRSTCDEESTVCAGKLAGSLCQGNGTSGVCSFNDGESEACHCKTGPCPAPSNGSTNSCTNKKLGEQCGDDGGVCQWSSRLGKCTCFSPPKPSISDEEIVLP